MDAIDRALEESLRRQRGGEPAPHIAAPAKEQRSSVDPFSLEAVLRAANEDDDLYDPYSDYMDMLSSEEYDDYDGSELV